VSGPEQLAKTPARRLSGECREALPESLPAARLAPFHVTDQDPHRQQGFERLAVLSHGFRQAQEAGALNGGILEFAEDNGMDSSPP
jgi:hypothetical protein